MSFFSSIRDAVFGGGDQTSTSSMSVVPPTQEEKDLLKKLLSSSDVSNSPTAGSEGEITAAFKKALAQFLASTEGGAPSSDMLDKATAYVDATFTNPAQASFDKFQRQYMANANEQAAALGRQPMDSAIQQQNFQTLADINAKMGAERGARIAQRTDELPMKNLTFINDLNQNAFQNRMGLLNLQSGLYNNMQNYRLVSSDKSVTSSGQNPGLLGIGASLASTYQNLGGKSLGKKIDSYFA